MANQDTALKTLSEFGIFNEDGVSRLAALIENLRSMSGAMNSGATRGRRRGRRKTAVARKARAPRAKSSRRRSGRGKFDPSKDELAKMRERMTGSQIAKKFKVSLATVGLRVRKYGLGAKRAGRRKARKAS